MKRSYGVPSKRTFKKTKYNQGADVALATSHYVVKQGRQDYAMTLIDPWAKLDCRIPDLACFPTATYTVEHNFEWNVAATNVATTNTQLLRVFMHGSAYYGFYNAFNITTGAPVASSQQQLPAFNTGTIPNGISSLYKSARVVSAGIKVSWAGNDSVTTGTIYSCYVPSDQGYTSGQNQVGFATPSAWTGQQEMYMGPMRLGAMCRYKPQDSASFDMLGTGAIPFADTTYIPGFGSFYIGVNAPLDTAGLKFNVNLVINYEALVVGSNLGIDTGVSDADPAALAHGLNIAGRSLSAFGASASSEENNVRAPARLVYSSSRKAKK